MRICEDGLYLITFDSYSLEMVLTSASTHRSVTCGAGKDWKRKQGNLTARKYIQQMTGLHCVSNRSDISLRNTPRLPVTPPLGWFRRMSSGILYNLVDVYWRFGGTCCFHLQEHKNTHNAIFFSEISCDWFVIIAVSVDLSGAELPTEEPPPVNQFKLYTRSADICVDKHKWTVERDVERQWEDRLADINCYITFSSWESPLFGERKQGVLRRTIRLLPFDTTRTA
jgi:hypothetical protein